MAGSIKYLRYSTDAGDLFALKADESNSELAGTADDLPAASVIRYTLPSNVKPRYARYASADGLVVRKAYICDPTFVPNATFIDPPSGLTLALRAVVAEETALPSGNDTGLIDGDAT